MFSMKWADTFLGLCRRQKFFFVGSWAPTSFTTSQPCLEVDPLLSYITHVFCTVGPGMAAKTSWTARCCVSQSSTAEQALASPKAMGMARASLPHSSLYYSLLQREGSWFAGSWLGAQESQKPTASWERLPASVPTDTEKCKQQLLQPAS